MWRKPDAKPVSGPSRAPSSVPPRTQAPTEVPPKRASGNGPSLGPASHAAAGAVASLASTIGAGLRIRGEISGHSDLYLDGEAHGHIRIEGARVTVGPKGKAKADIEAREIVVNGEVLGNLKAADRVCLGSSCRVNGALAAPNIGIDDGAEFHGKVEVTRVQTTPVAPEREPAADAEWLRPVGAHAEEE